MAKLSRNQRKHIREAVIIAIAHLGLIAPDGKNKNDQGENSTPRQSAPPEKLKGVITEVFTVSGILGIWQFLMSGPYNFFGNQPFILYSGAAAFSILFLFGGYRMVVLYKRHWIVFMLAICGCGVLFVSTYFLIQKKQINIALLEAQKAVESKIINGLPNRFKKLDTGLSKINSALEAPKPVDQSIDLNYLERRYPIAFNVFQNNQRTKHFESVYTKGNYVWDIDWNEVKIEDDPDGKIAISIPVRTISGGKSGLASAAATLWNATGSTLSALKPKVLAKEST